MEHRHRELEDLGAFDDDDERNVSISGASSGSIAGSRSLVGAFASALDFLAACRAAFPSLRLAQEAVAHAAIRIAAEAGSRPPGRSRSRSRRPSTIAVEAIAFCQITIPSLGERRTRLHLYLTAAEAALRRRLPSQAESLIRASIADAAAAEDADAAASEDAADASEDASDEGASDRLTDADFLEYVRTCASALAYLPGHPSGVNVLRVPEGLRRVVDARRFRDGGRVGAAATAIRARVALIRLSAALAQRRTPYRVRGVASNAEMFFSSTLARAPGAIREEEDEEEEEEEEEFVEEEEEADGDGGRGHPGDDRSGDGDDRWSAAYASEALAFTHALVEAATGEAQRVGEGDRDAAGAALDLAEAVESCLAPTPEIRRLAEALRARVAEKVRQELV